MMLAGKNLTDEPIIAKVVLSWSSPGSNPFIPERRLEQGVDLFGYPQEHANYCLRRELCLPFRM